jgi:hypothetical protein
MTRQSIKKMAVFLKGMDARVKPGHDRRSSFRDGPNDQTRNLEIPGSMLRIAPE